MSITSANSIYMLAIVGLFDSPQQLQGFAADDIFTTEDLQSTEGIMGVDGFLSGGFVFMPILQSIALQADSLSNEIFDQWYNAQQTARDVFYANATISLTSLGKKYTMTKGLLTRYKPMPDAAKTLTPRRFGVTWQSVNAANV